MKNNLMPQTSPMSWMVLCITIFFNMNTYMMNNYNMNKIFNKMNIKINNIMWMW